MAFSIANIFGGGGQPQQTQGTTQSLPQTSSGTTQPGISPSGQAPSAEQQQNAAQGTPQGNNPQQATPEPNFLDSVKDIWNNPANPQGQRPALNADVAKIAEVANKLNFTSTINPQLVQKALAGDQAAFVQCLNAVGQQGFIAAAQASSHLVDKQSSSVIDHVERQLPNQIKSFQSRDAFLTKNPNFSHQAVAPILGVIQTQLAQHFPNATSSELSSYSERYLTEMVSALSTKQKGEGEGDSSQTGSFAATMQQKMQANNAFDWENWANAAQTQQQGA
jgi:hypothetical protein